jgi:hypothetical protein
VETSGRNRTMTKETRETLLTVLILFSACAVGVAGAWVLRSLIPGWFHDDLRLLSALLLLVLFPVFYFDVIASFMRRPRYPAPSLKNRGPRNFWPRALFAIAGAVGLAMASGLVIRARATDDLSAKALIYLAAFILGLEVVYMVVWQTRLQSAADYAEANG